ncbi:MAG: homoserine dehydrogenase [Clostridiales bacterium]|jgi:homoserine dehydrogenase|nr:homoserine dehydrogenase [Clostridiales bacterium]
MKTVNVAIMGIGTVGGGAYDILTANRDLIRRTRGLDICVTAVLDRSPEYVAKRTGGAARAATLDEIIADKSISIVVETMGGVEPAKTFIIKALLSGKSVVTANKELISKHWSELETAAKKGGAGLYFEASCVGGVPVIRALTMSMQGDNITELTGIINGTTNYILTKMDEDGKSFDAALKEAQAAGFAEANPAADVEGYDAMYKLSILSSLAFHTSVPYGCVYREGITAVTQSDVENGRALGYTLKLLAIGRKRGDKIEVRVHPTFLPHNHPLAAVRNEFNAVFLKGDGVDDIMLYGRGAGARPTGSAIVSDIVTCAKAAEPTYSTFNNNGQLNPPTEIEQDFTSKYYLSLTLPDNAGTLSKITEILGNFGISIGAVIQKEASDGFARVLFLTHDTRENAVRGAIEKFKKSPRVKSVDSLIRVI